MGTDNAGCGTGMGATMIGMGVGAAASGTDAGAMRMTGGLLPVLGDVGHGEWLCVCCAGIFFVP